MAQNQNGFGPGVGVGGGGFLQILGIIYLIKIIRRRREQRRLAAANGPDPQAGQGPQFPTR